VRPRAPQPASTLYVALAAEDDYVSTPACTDLANAYAAAGGSATVKVYPGAAHGFDGDPERTQLTYLPRADNYRDCLVYLDSDGRFDYRGTTYAADDAALIADLRRTCMKRGASVWTHPRQKAAATRDVIEFLDRTLAR
jgi:dienelactone hydrolase